MKDIPTFFHYLLEHGADVDSRTENSWTSLHWASCRGTPSAGKCLLDHGADINARDRDDWTPLYVCVLYATSEGLASVEFAQMLLERGAVIDARDSRGRTSLHRAVGEGKIRFARLLLEHGADANAQDKSGETPSQYTMQQEILELLSEYGAESVK
jgi:cytohesin